MYVPVIVAGLVVVTVDVFTTKLVEVVPAEIVTWLGTMAAELLDDNLTIAPPVGAGNVRLTTPLDEVPPKTVEGVRVRVARVSGVVAMASIAFTDEPLQAAVIVAWVLLVTAKVAILKIATVLPESIWLLAGGIAFGLFDLIVTT